MKNVEQPLDPVEYSFWLPPEGMTLTTGPEDEEIQIPQVPLPLHSRDLEKSSSPSEKLIGDGLYDYLRRYPDCPRAVEYAKILQAAYPFYFADIGSQIIMLEAKEVDPPYIRRKINLMKILALVEPENFGLLQRIGIAYYELALIYSELIHVRRELGNSRSWLEKARRLMPDEITTLNYLAQICYFSGAYPQAKLYWKLIAGKLEDEAALQELRQRIARLEEKQVPPYPLLESLEGIGVAMEHYNIKEYAEACIIMERIEEEGSLPRELPNPEFFYFLGLCREKTGDLAAAFESYSKTMELEPNHQAAEQGIERIQTDSEVSR